MTKSEARHVAAILNAWADGETIQIRGCNEKLNVWKDSGITFRSLMTCPHMYRIKPKPLTGWTTRESICKTPPPEPSMYDWVHVREVTDDA